MTLTIPPRFTGPPGSANGGCTAGLLAGVSRYDGPVAVTLRRPPPLGVPMRVVRYDGRVVLERDGELVAEATPGALDGEPPAPVDAAAAAQAATRYSGLVDHPFPGCFVCGTAPPVDVGLHLQPGPVGGVPNQVATPWRARETAPELVWAALDCPGGWASEVPGRPLVLGRMTALVSALPAVGESCVVVGAAVGGEGRKVFSSTAAYGDDGRLLGQARATWIRVDPTALGD